MKHLHIFTLCLSLVLISCNKNDPANLTATGTIEAREISLSAQVAGQIQSLKFEEGQKILEGDTLLFIDSRDWRFQLQQAEAALAATEAQLRLALKGARDEDIAQAEASYKSAELDVSRLEDLWKTKSIPQKMLDDARTRFTVALQAYEKIKRATRQEDLDAARARRNQASASVLSMQKKVADCIVLAPVQGTITKRFVERGEMVGTGTTLARVANLEEMDITIYFNEVDLPRIKLQQKAMVRVDAFPDRDFEGRVVYISPIAEFTPKNIQTKEERTKLVFAVKLKIANPDGILKAGIPADVTIHIAE
ncbi:MAG: efflux RND transporter periplasmic adaptor subunit [bacterium]